MATKTTSIPSAGALLRLADKNVEKFASDFGALPLDIRESLTRQAAERRAEIVDAAASEILNLLNFKDEYLVGLAQRKAALLNEITAIDSQAEAAERAAVYGAATQNFLPLLKQVKLPVPSEADANLLSIPKDWVAPAAAPATEAPAA